MVGPDEIRLTGPAQPLFRPSPVPGHDGVDPAERDLQGEDSETLAALEDGRRHECRGRAERWGVLSKSMSWTKSASTALLASRNARPSFVFRNGADPRLVAKSTFLATRIDDAAGLVVDEQEIVVSRTGG